MQENTGQIMPQQKQLEDANEKLTEEQNLIREKKLSIEKKDRQLSELQQTLNES